MKRIALCAALAALLLPGTALAWGGTGHTMVNAIGAAALPADVPIFVRGTDGIAEIATLGPEMDRLKGAGTSWDADNDNGHFLDIGDDDKVGGIITLDALPESFVAYDAALRKVGMDPFKEGFLPYTILDGWQQVRKDFAYYRVDAYLTDHAKSDADKAFFARDMELRMALTIRDIGVWGHFIGDASQPLHITVHFNGWGDYPNPKNYTTRHIHSFFEGVYVRDHAKASDVTALLTPYVAADPQTLISNADMLKRIGAYLASSNARVIPVYDLFRTGDFDRGSPRATALVDQCLAAGASEYRDLIALAWEDSINETVSYPEIAVKDIVSGKVTIAPQALTAQ